MVGAGQVEFDAGETIDDFNEKKLLENIENIKTFDFQGTTKCPGLIHKDTWIHVGGWSEEFSPTGGDDTDFAMKLWCYDVRIFKGLGKCLAYHFGSITTRKKDKSLFTYLGSKGNKIFLLKWGITIKFFRKYYLKSETVYKDQLDEPKKDLFFLIGLLKCKIYYIYVKYIYNFNDKIKLVSK
jgi:hypothetical protein